RRRRSATRGQPSSASVTSGGRPGPRRHRPCTGMTRSVSSTYSAMRRVSRSAITKTSHGLTCVNTPILGTLQLPHKRRATHPELQVNDLGPVAGVDPPDLVDLGGRGAALELR